MLSAGRHAGVALAERLGVLVVALAAVHQVEGRLDVGAANLHCWGIRIRHMLRCNGAALAQCTVAGAATEHRLVLDVDLEMGELNLKSHIAGSLKITFLLFQNLSQLFSIVSLAGKYCPPRGC